MGMQRRFKPKIEMPSKKNQTYFTQREQNNRRRHEMSKYSYGHEGAFRRRDRGAGKGAGSKSDYRAGLRRMQRTVSEKILLNMVNLGSRDRGRGAVWPKSSNETGSIGYRVRQTRTIRPGATYCPIRAVALSGMDPRQSLRTNPSPHKARFAGRDRSCPRSDRCADRS